MAVLLVNTEEFMFMENLLTNNLFADSSSTSQAIFEEKEKKKKAIRLTYHQETEWKNIRRQPE